MKKKLLFLLFLPISLIGVGCNVKTIKVTVNAPHCDYDKNIVSWPEFKDFTMKISPSTGYELDKSNFKILENGDDVTSWLDKDKGWTFKDNTLSIPKNLMGGDIYIEANATKEATKYKVTITADDKITAYEAFPTEASSKKDFEIKFNVAANFGFNADIKIANKEYNKYTYIYNGEYLCLKIKSDDIIGDIAINLTSEEGKITTSKNKVEIKNYDTFDVYVYNPTSSSLTYTKNDDSFSIVEFDWGVRIESLSDAVCSNKTINISNGNASTSVDVTVYHPKDIQEALDSTTLGFIRGNTSFKLTFDFNNSFSWRDFSDALEISENMYIDSSVTGGMTANYYTGTGKQNEFILEDIEAHGRDYGYLNTSDGSAYVKPGNANYAISKNSLDDSTSTVALDNSEKSITVYNSEELFWAVEHGYLPTFPDTSSMTTSKKTHVENAKKIYEMGRKIIIEETRDSMNTFNEIVALFHYLENILLYDYDVTKIGTYSEWLKYSPYFMEGVFLNNGYAVCDGFAKSFAFLCCLDNLPVIRSFGYCNSGGHAWNYAKIDDVWYLICPTWAQGLVDEDNINFYGKSFRIFDYNSLLRSSSYFKDRSGTQYSDDAFPSIIRSSKNYNDNIYEIITAGNSGYNYYIDYNSSNQLQTIFSLCASAGLSKTKFFLTLKSNSFDTTKQSMIINAASKSSLTYNAINVIYASGDYTIYVLFK